MAAQWFSRLLTVGSTGDDVTLVQRKLNLPSLGTYDAGTAARVRGVQHKAGLMVTGMVDASTSEFIGESIRAGLVPDWYSRGLAFGSEGDDVLRVCAMLDLEPHRTFDKNLEDRVRQFQSAHGFPLTGSVTEDVAVAIGDDAAWTQ